MLPDTLGLVAGTLRVLSSFWSGSENAIFIRFVLLSVCGN